MNLDISTLEADQAFLSQILSNLNQIETRFRRSRALSEGQRKLLKFLLTSLIILPLFFIYVGSQKVTDILSILSYDSTHTDYLTAGNWLMTTCYLISALCIFSAFQKALLLKGSSLGAKSIHEIQGISRLIEKQRSNMPALSEKINYAIEQDDTLMLYQTLNIERKIDVLDKISSKWSSSDETWIDWPRFIVYCLTALSFIFSTILITKPVFFQFVSSTQNWYDWNLPEVISFSKYAYIAAIIILAIIWHILRGMTGDNGIRGFGFRTFLVLIVVAILAYYLGWLILTIPFAVGKVLTFAFNIIFYVVAVIIAIALIAFVVSIISAFN